MGLSEINYADECSKQGGSGQQGGFGQQSGSGQQTDNYSDKIAREVPWRSQGEPREASGEPACV